MDTEDVDIDVENLFNDGGHLDISEHAIATSALAPGLGEQFLNQRFCGGYDKVSWSRQGHVAVVSEDGATVGLHCLRVSAKTREWKLSVARPLESAFENVVNVTWSPSGFDLAITDARGRLSIYSMTTTSINRLNESKSTLIDGLDELGMPVGTWWLNQDRGDRPRNIVAGATRGDEKWTHNLSKAKALGPLYPRAFCMINRQGILYLVYQRPGARYTKTSVNLPSLSDTTCSHAAFSPTQEGKILLAVYTVTGNLAVYQVQLSWPADLMTDPTSSSQPDLIVETVDSCVSIWSDYDVVNNNLNHAHKPDDWALTHLLIVPTSDVETALHEPPCIWGVYTSAGPAPNTAVNGFSMTSVIKRWSISLHTRALHPRFDDIPTKTESSTTEEDIFAVERLTDLVFPQAVTAIELIDGGQMVAITTTDGKTELWNPVTQALVSFEGQINEVTSIAQFGFAFHPTANSITSILSPNACANLSFAEDLKSSLKYMQYPIQTTGQNLDLTDPQQSASVAAVVLAFARSCWSNTNTDDVVACILANYTIHQYTTILSELYRTLFRDTEFIHERAPDSEVERLVSKPITLRVLSFQMSILNNKSISTSSSDEEIRYASLASVWAWLAINLRSIATTFYIFYREYQTSTQTVQNPNQPPPHPPSTSFVDAICNTIHWVLDLFRFMLSTILQIGDRQTNPNFFTPPTFANNLGDVDGDGSQGLVALILNCQWTRTFLIAISRAMRAFIDTNERGNNPLLGRVVHAIHRYSRGKGMHISAIEKLLDPRWYARTGLREGEQLEPATIAKRQMAMYSSGRMGPEYAKTLRTLLDKVINEHETGLRATGEIERVKLFMETHDLNWLLLGYNPQFWAEPKPHPLDSRGSNHLLRPRKLYDIHRKSMIIVRGTPDQLIRRCVRCGSVSGDIDGPDKSWSKNMVTILARCVCDACWIVEPIDGEVESR